MKPKMSETIPLLDILSPIWTEQQNRPTLSQLLRIWEILRESAILEDQAAKQDYADSLDQALLKDGMWKLPIAREILELRGFLSDVQIPAIFADYAKHTTFLHEALFHLICKWLSGSIVESTKATLVEAAENAIVILDQTSWIPKKSEYPNTWASLLFPAIIWAHGGKESEGAESVFLRGIRSIFDHIPSPSEFPRNNLTKLLSQLDPLLANAPQQVLCRVVHRGIESMEPSVSVFCRLIEAFNKHLENK
jgi:hypothetical protein